jgi:hypothetical protein
MQIRELKHCSVKTILMIIINSPTLYQWHARMRDIGSDLFGRNEYIQQSLVLIGLYQRFICEFLLFLFAHKRRSFEKGNCCYGQKKVKAIAIKAKL